MFRSYRNSRLIPPLFLPLFIFLTSSFAMAQVSVKGYAPQRRESGMGQRAPVREAPPSRRHSSIRHQNAPLVKLGKPSAREMRGDLKKLKYEKRLRIGAVRPLPRRIDSGSGIAFHDVTEGRVGIFRLASEGAIGIRARLENISEDAKIFVYSATNRDEFYGPLTAKDAGESGSTWTPPVEGDSIVIEFLMTGKKGSLPFSVAEISHIFSDPSGRGSSGAQQAGPCNNNVPAEWSEAARSVGRIQIVNSKGEFACTGVLLNTTNNSGMPYFLSANHCLSSQAETNNMIVRWFNYTGDGSASSNPISYGGTLLSTGEASDYTLIRLRTVPEGVRFSGWTTAEPAISAQVASIHHPGNSYQRYSRGNLTTADCDSFFIGAEFCGNFHKVRWDSGITEPGSSGGPLWIGSPSDPQLIGILTGGTSSCDNRSGIDLFNRFDVAFKAFSQYLTGDGCAWELSERGGIFAANGENATIDLRAIGDKKDCGWTAASNVPWITITSASSGSGDSTIGFNVATNPGNDPRYAAIYIAGQQFFVIQVGSPNPGDCPAIQHTLGTNTGLVSLPTSCRSVLNFGADAQRFTFEGLAGQQIWLSATSGDFDPMMLLIGPDGSIIEFNDDAGGLTARIPGDARSDFMTLPANGTYTLEVTTYEPGESGAYGLSSFKYCRYRLPADHAIIGPEATTIELDVIGPPDCSYRAESKVDWIRFEKGTNYTGGQKIKVIVDETSDYAVASWADKRSSVITVADQGFNVIQRLKCGRYLTLKPSAQHAPGGAYNNLLHFTTGLHCNWSLTKDVDWIKFEGPISGTSYIETRYSIDSINLSPNPRVGRIMAGDAAFTITQLGIGENCQATPIGIGQTITSKLSANCRTLLSDGNWNAPSNYYTFSGTAGQKIVISATSLAKNYQDHTAGELRLISPSNKALDVYASGKLFAEGALKIQYPETGYLTLPETGTYTLHLSARQTGQLPSPDQPFLLTVADGGGIACELGLSSVREAKKSTGDTGKIDVILQADSQCSWTAVSADPWITITSGAQGIGHGSFTYSVAPNAGDQLRTGLIVVAGRHIPVSQFPNIAAAVSSADFRPRLGLDSLTSVFGAKLAVRTESATSLPLPTKLGGTTVNFITPFGIVWDCGLNYVSPQQINFVLPASEFATGYGLVEIRSEDGTITYSQVFVDRDSYSLFSANSNGQGVAAAQLIRVKPDNSQIWEDVAMTDGTGKRVARDLKLGPDVEKEYLVLYGTGFRQLINSFYLKAEVGGEECQVIYAGPQYDFAGLAQVNILLPKSLRGRGEVPVKIRYEGKESNVVTVRFGQ